MSKLLNQYGKQRLAEIIFSILKEKQDADLADNKHCGYVPIEDLVHKVRNLAKVWKLDLNNEEIIKCLEHLNSKAFEEGQLEKLQKEKLQLIDRIENTRGDVGYRLCGLCGILAKYAYPSDNK